MVRIKCIYQSGDCLLLICGRSDLCLALDSTLIITRVRVWFVTCYAELIELIDVGHGACVCLEGKDWSDELKTTSIDKMSGSYFETNEYIKSVMITIQKHPIE